MWHLQRRNISGEQLPGLTHQFALKEVLSRNVFNLHIEDNLSRFLPVEEPALQLGLRHSNLVQVCLFRIHVGVTCGHHSHYADE